MLLPIGLQAVGSEQRTVLCVRQNSAALVPARRAPGVQGGSLACFAAWLRTQEEDYNCNGVFFTDLLPRQERGVEPLTNVKVNRVDGGYDAQQSRTGAERSLIPELQNNIIEQNMSGKNQDKLLHPAVVDVVVVWYHARQSRGKEVN